MTVKLNNELGKCNQIKKKKRETRDVVSVWNDSDTTVKNNDDHERMLRHDDIREMETCIMVIFVCSPLISITGDAEMMA